MKVIFPLPITTLRTILKILTSLYSTIQLQSPQSILFTNAPSPSSTSFGDTCLLKSPQCGHHLKDSFQNLTCQTEMVNFYHFSIHSKMNIIVTVHLTPPPPHCHPPPSPPIVILSCKDQVCGRAIYYQSN